VKKTAIIGLLGEAGSGKTTVAKYLEERYGATRCSIAKPLKEIVKDILQFTDEQVYGDYTQKEALDPRYGFSPRDAMERAAETIWKNLGSKVLVRAALRVLPNEPGIYVFDDLRCEEDASLIKKARWGDLSNEDSMDPCGHVVKIICTENTSQATGAAQVAVNQVPMHLIDAVIAAPKGVPNLLACAKEIFSGVLEGRS
jgi:ABC-type dipeptide/oligopeptide/nickel transport system ATPase component